MIGAICILLAISPFLFARVKDGAPWYSQVHDIENMPAGVLIFHILSMSFPDFVVKTFVI